MRATSVQSVVSAERHHCEPNFYLLPFASQMIVWAMRKQFRSQAAGEGDAKLDEVLHVLHMADWAPLYAELLAVFEVIAQSSHERRFELHAAGCPCLAPHEAHLLNAIAHLRYDRREEAVLSLCETLPPANVRLVLPHLAVIATTFARDDVQLACISVRAWTDRNRSAQRLREIH